MYWLREPETFNKATNKLKREARRHTYISRYNARNDIENYNVIAAYSWLNLPTISEDNSTLTYPCKNLSFKSMHVQRDDSDDIITNKLNEGLSYCRDNNADVTVLTINTSQKQSSAQILESTAVATGFVEQDLRTMVTVSTTHKIKIFKNEYNEFLIITNLCSKEILFKTAAAVFYSVNTDESKAQYIEPYMNGDGIAINNLLGEYVRPYEEYKEAHKLEDALKEVTEVAVYNQKRQYIEDIRYAEENLKCELDTIRSYQKRLEEAKAKYMYFMLNNNSDNITDLIEFINACKDKITHIAMNGTRLEVCYKTKLKFWEKQHIETYFSTNRTNCVTQSPDYIKQLLKEIFIDKTVNLIMESGVSVNIGTEYATPSYVDPLNAREIRIEELVGLPNPHHLYYNCWGDNASVVSELLCEYKYAQALAQMFTAVSAINLSDIAVLDKFVLNELHDYEEVPCLELPDKSIITIVQYREKLNA